jgi:uncharacterized membrane protein
MRRRRSGDDAAINLVLTLIAIVFFMPIVGLYFLLRKNPDKKVLGWVLLIGGIILWIITGIIGT